ncbi:MAG: 4-(cytidine 5'-diphospho)-2-C-methyl-D-erythritol kinase [Victivallales bacterium]|nr:4-(cytidine 5'-diphospho)-2-C-methyl-D-erythritol kinase [Victivallales bacterium]
MNEILKTTTPAKINLHLKVLDARPDGYHDIRTVFHPVLWLLDDVELEMLEPSIGAIEVLCPNSNAPNGEGNICFDAAAKFAKAAGVEPSWCVKIVKRIPVAAGLGGGSSDAAALLRLLNGKFGNLQEDELRELALSIGADVPFFLDPKPSIGTGLGEILEPIDFNLDLNLLIVNPRFPISAAWAYRNMFPVRNGDPDSTESAILAALRSGSTANLPEMIHNDLAPALIRKFPLLQILLDDLGDVGAVSRGVSGSGPTLFGVFADRTSLRSASAKIAELRGEAVTLLHQPDDNRGISKSEIQN